MKYNVPPPPPPPPRGGLRFRELILLLLVDCCVSGFFVFGRCFVMYLGLFGLAIDTAKEEKLVALLELCSCRRVGICILRLFLVVPWSVILVMHTWFVSRTW